MRYAIVYERFPFTRVWLRSGARPGPDPTDVNSYRCQELCAPTPESVASQGLGSSMEFVREPELTRPGRLGEQLAFLESRPYICSETEGPIASFETSCARLLTDWMSSPQGKGFEACRRGSWAH
jgi:hypothetical protein